MPFKVLLADDNITAQRMGSKILTDAGYEVIAVSNGAAAVKKIAAEKPELLILDVFMPGYSGLEVCEKVKKDPATASVPVILTATNMEPYNQADGHRVGADGFLVKPFEASDLIAVVQKLQAKTKPAKQDDYPKTMKMAAVEDFSDSSYEEWKSDSVEEPGQHKVEVPQEMAASPAFMDDYAEAAPAAAAAATEPVPAFSIDQPAVHEEAAPAFAIDAPPAMTDENAAPAFVPDAPVEFGGAPAFVMEHTLEPPVEAAPPAFEMPSLVSPDMAETSAIEIPSAHDSAPTMSAPAEFEPTSAAPASIEVSTAPELETTSIESPNIVATQDSALVTNPDEISQFATGFGVQNAESIPVGIAMPEMTAAPSGDTTQKIEAYSEPEPATPAVEEAQPQVEVDMQRAFSVGGSGAAAAPAMSAEPEPAQEPPAPAPIPDELVAQFAAELDQAHEERQAMGVAEPPLEEALTEASMEVAKEIPASQLDEEKIAAAVNRALEKYKDGLRSELIATIVRELKG